MITSNPTLQTLIATMTGAGVRDAAHSERVVALTQAVCERLQVSAEIRDQAQLVAALHDLGKLGIPREILEKDTPLTAEERRTLCQWPVIGAQMVRELPDLGGLAPLLEATHERWDGLGYPAGLLGQDIPVPSRIVFVCNAYVTMLEDRPYRPAMPRDFALNVIEQSATKQFWPEAARALVAIERGQTQAAAAATTRRTHEASAARAPARAADGGIATIDEVRAALERQRIGRVQADRQVERQVERARHEEERPRLPLVVWAMLLAAGTALGVLAALPLPSAHKLCGSASQGGVECTFDKVVTPAIETIVLVPILVTLLTVLLLRTPGWLRRWRSGSLQVRQKLVLVETDDPVLAAASWGLVMRDARAPEATPSEPAAQQQDKPRIRETGASAFIAASRASR